MESSRPPTIAKKVWHILQVVYYMLRKGMPKRKVMMDLHLLLRRGKIASKALGNLLMTFRSHQHHHHSTTAPSSSVAGTGINGFSCRSMDPNLSFYDPREVEFSCSNTPSYSYPSLTKRSSKNRHSHRDYDYEAAAAIAKAFDILNTEASSAAASDAESSVAPSPMKTPMWGRFGKKSPMAVRQLRVTDSPFPIKEEEAVDHREVDREAEEFIRRFYEQLRRQQQSIGATPDYYRVVRRA